MYPFVNNEPVDSLADNIISRHFNQSLSSEPFSLNSHNPQDPQDPQDPHIKPNSRASANQNEFSSNYSSERQPNQSYQIPADQKYEKNFESDYQLSENYRNETLLEETIFNKHDKLHQLIADCELINNNNINNFVNYSSEDLRRSLNAAQQGERPKMAMPATKCNCQCHCTNHKTKRNPFHLTNKLLHSLAKIKLNSSSSQKSQSVDKRSDNNSCEDYNSFAPSLSNYSLSSSSSISSQTVSVSSTYSSAADNYGHSLATALKRPVRKPPPLPPPVQDGDLHPNARIPYSKPPAELPASAFRSDDGRDKSTNGEQHAQNDTSPTKRSSNEDNHYERVITKSFENLLIGDIKERAGQRISLEDRFKERPIGSRLFGRNDLLENEFKDEQEESIYETIGDSDYDLTNDESFRDCFGGKSQDEEDLYQDIDLLDEGIYESLPNELSGSNNLPTANRETSEAVYVNESADKRSADYASELDRKLMKQQKALDKKREMRAEKLRKKFNLLGNEVPLMSGIVKKNQSGNSLNLTVNKGEVVLVLRIHGNPSGMWLAKDERSKIGYISNQLVEVDLENYKSLMNEPKIF